LDFQQTLGDQCAHCLPDHRPADAKLAGEFALGRKAVAGLEVTLDDQLLNLMRNAIGQGSTPMNRLEHIALERGVLVFRHFLSQYK
jgi:hypothetical protein